TALVRLILREGRKREVKRMMEAIGYPVRRLRRLSFAGITVRGLNPGQWRQLTAAEIHRLRALPDRTDRTGDSGRGR
ncbi:MAG TPA: rRNA pseudouridine synthase, partial [Acidobacteriota bacterium]|nr:rRNA pseudouridine synthase [Acidobacteriota bacterium]